MRTTAIETMRIMVPPIEGNTSYRAFPCQAAGFIPRNYRRRLCRRLIGIFDPIVLGGPCNVTGCCAVVAPPPDGEYARSNRVTTGLRSPDGTNAPGLASVQSAGGGRGTNPSTCATGMTMLIRF